MDSEDNINEEQIVLIREDPVKNQLLQETDNFKVKFCVWILPLRRVCVYFNLLLETFSTFCVRNACLKMVTNSINSLFFVLIRIPFLLCDCVFDNPLLIT